MSKIQSRRNRDSFILKAPISPTPNSFFSILKRSVRFKLQETHIGMTQWLGTDCGIMNCLKKIIRYQLPMSVDDCGQDVVSADELMNVHQIFRK
jgi:hypothetical protein